MATAAELKGMRRRRRFLPSAFRYLAWLLTVLVVLGAGAVTLYLTFRFSWSKWSLWWQSVYLSLVCCVFLSHPLLVLVCVVISVLRGGRDPSVLCHQADEESWGLGETNSWHRKPREVPDCCEECAELERGVAARQRSRYLRFARPPQEKQLIEARKKIQKARNAVLQFRDGITFGLLFFLLCLIALSEDTSSSYQLNRNLHQMFAKHGPLPFEKVQTPWQWYQWSQSALLQTVYGPSHKPQLPQQMEFVEGGGSYLIGPVQLRQLRMAPVPCKTLPFLVPRQGCHQRYSTASSQTGSFGVNHTWHYSASVEAAPVWGKHALYDSSGFVVHLNRSREGAWRQLSLLPDQGWLDADSRAVLVEITLYNAPTNLFSAVTLLLEMPAEGRPSTRVSVDSVRLFRYSSLLDHCVLAAQLLLIGTMLWRVKVELGRLVTLRRAYFYQLWNWVEFATGVVAVVYGGALIFRFALVAVAVEKLRSSYYSGHVSLALLALWQQCLQCLVGILLFLVMLRSVRLLRHNRPFLHLTSTLVRAQRELLAITAGYGCLLMALASLGLGLFVSTSASFCSLWQALLTVCSLMTGNTSLLAGQEGILVDLFLLATAVFGTGLLTCWIVAVLTRRLRLRRRCRKMEPRILGLGELAQHLWDSLLFSLHVNRANATEEGEPYMPPEFILAEIVYQVDELLFRMNALCGSSGLPDKPIHYLTDSDATQGPGGDDGISSGGSEEQMGGLGGGKDSERLEQRVQKIEDKLYANEPYLAQLLKLDSIGADVLSQEREKQLRSHLELEIFRQLQMQRQEGVVPRSECLNTANKMAGEVPGLESSLETAGFLPSTLPRRPPFSSNSPHSGQSMVCTEGSLRSFHSLTETTSSGLPASKVPPPALSPAPSPPSMPSPSPPSMPSPASTPSPWAAKPWSASSDTGSSEGERGGKVLANRPGEDRKGLVAPDSGVLGARDSRHSSGTPPEGRSSASSSSEGRSRPPPRAWVEAGEGAVPRGRPPSGPLRVGPEHLLSHGEGAMGWVGMESSSGSEQDSTHGGRRALGRRNLRKTKSRGKGKGAGELGPSLLLSHLQEWEGPGAEEPPIPLSHSPATPDTHPRLSPEHSF